MDNTFLILLLYYERPNMVQNALRSIKALDYSNWELAFIDDGVLQPGKPIVESLLPDLLGKVQFYNSHHSVEDKIKNKGSHMGRLMNQAISKSNAQYGLMLCDDDALFPDYLTNLNTWFKAHPKQTQCYCDVVFFNPFKETPQQLQPDPYIWYGTEKVDRVKHFLNKGGRTVRASNCLDASQVVWNLDWQRKHKCWFPFPKTKNLDADFYKNLGYCQPAGFNGQYKAYYPSNLTTRTDQYAIIDLPCPPP